ncbi:MAG: U32 family peptidase [Variibacter sp.]
MQLTLGPILYNWAPELWRDFYFRIAEEAPVDTVVVGEVVCSKRSPFFAEHLPHVVERLVSAGKSVLLGSLILPSLARERRQMAELAQTDGMTVEVNDVTCLAHLQGQAHAIGPFVNVYNEATAEFLVRQGARRICLPPELPLQSIAAIAAAMPDIAIEVFAFGKVPLAISARCYHARIHKLSKDNCRFVCEQDPDGLTVDTLDGESFLSVNGVQTLSHTCANLIANTHELVAAGVGALRLSPQQCDMVAVARTFRDVLDGRCDVGSAIGVLEQLYPQALFADGFIHGVPGHVLAGKGARSAPGPGAGMVGSNGRFGS